ncbi:type VI secretion protein [Fulvitalea axinellae]|uniref:Type VI secretion protein n=1 Tax=Fulvitalea axinellae TaxID=1182444 RepID=A0AAU9CU80_9BACT|nr:type VI secretion protein [Fulvitalea axinellae]
MGQPAARMFDMHTCPQQDTYGPVVVPHVGVILMGPGAMTVTVGKLPAAVMGDIALCVSPSPNSVLKGSGQVFLCKRPAVRQGDSTAHGGVVSSGCPTVEMGG